jgi:hypothetical protein
MLEQRIAPHRLAGLGAADLHAPCRPGAAAEVVVVADDAVHLGARQVEALGDRGTPSRGTWPSAPCNLMQDRQQRAGSWARRARTSG